MICPKCKKKLTVGVLHRVDDLADREEKDIPTKKFIPHKYIIPLKEVIANVFAVGSKSKKVEKEYDAMINKIGNEFYILLHATEKEILFSVSDQNIWVGIENMRRGNVKVSPGYDGLFGEVDVLPIKENRSTQSRLL